MDLHSSVTLGDPEFPPKNGVIIKQGDIFVQENRKVLFVKWKVYINIKIYTVILHKTLYNYYETDRTYTYTRTVKRKVELCVF